jgi:hypothetical protein
MSFFDLRLTCTASIRKKLRAASPALEFGNELFRIRFNNSGPFTKEFGETFHFFLQDAVDCPEFLVHPPTLFKYVLLFKGGSRDRKF